MAKYIFDLFSKILGLILAAKLYFIFFLKGFSGKKNRDEKQVYFKSSF
jgi:hypothetical protein